jgi:hypothetical protein
MRAKKLNKVILVLYLAIVAGAIAFAMIRVTYFTF